MPIYEYKCDGCGHEFEQYKPVEAWQEPELCPKCDYGLGRKQLSAGYFRSFDAYVERNISHDAKYVRNRGELNDEIKRFNDTELAEKEGKVAIFDGDKADESIVGKSRRKRRK